MSTWALQFRGSGVDFFEIDIRSDAESQDVWLVGERMAASLGLSLYGVEKKL